LIRHDVLRGSKHGALRGFCPFSTFCSASGRFKIQKLYVRFNFLKDLL